jgi:hypothetical protein
VKFKLFGAWWHFSFDPGAWWVGVRVERSGEVVMTTWEVWVCLIPCLPLYVWWDRVKPEWRER